jgi:hypothetical protein
MSSLIYLKFARSMILSKMMSFQLRKNINLVLIDIDVDTFVILKIRINIHNIYLAE